MRLRVRLRISPRGRSQRPPVGDIRERRQVDAHSVLGGRSPRTSGTRGGALRPLQGQAGAGAPAGTRRSAGWPTDSRHRHQPDAGGGGQDHHHHRIGRCDEPHRQAGRGLPARAQPRPCFGIKGGAAGGGRSAGRADGRDQPALHRRLPRHHLGQQPAVGDDRQPPLLGQRARPRPAPADLAAVPGHERPVAAPRTSSALGRHERLPARGPASTSPSPPR